MCKPWEFLRAHTIEGQHPFCGRDITLYLLMDFYRPPPIPFFTPIHAVPLGCEKLELFFSYFFPLPTPAPLSNIRREKSFRRSFSKYSSMKGFVCLANVIFFNDKCMSGRLFQRRPHNKASTMAIMTTTTEAITNTKVKNVLIIFSNEVFNKNYFLESVNDASVNKMFSRLLFFQRNQSALQSKTFCFSFNLYFFNRSNNDRFRVR